MHKIVKSRHTELHRLAIFRRPNILKGAISVTVPDMDLGMFEIVDLISRNRRVVALKIVSVPSVYPCTKVYIFVNVSYDFCASSVFNKPHGSLCYQMNDNS